MNPKISFLRNPAKLTKLFYKNPSDSLKELLMSKTTECSNLIVTANENYHKKMAEKLDILQFQKHTGLNLATS